MLLYNTMSEQVFLRQQDLWLSAVRPKPVGLVLWGGESDYFQRGGVGWRSEVAVA